MRLAGTDLPLTAVVKGIEPWVIMKSVRLFPLFSIGLMFVSILTACAGNPSPPTQATEQGTLAPLPPTGKYDCLWLDDLYVHPNQIMVNLITGEQVKTDPLPPPPSSAYSVESYASPNGRYVVAWGRGKKQDGLYLQSAGEEHLSVIKTNGYPGDPRVGYGQGSAPAPMAYPFPIQWSPDSAHLAYVWKEGEKYYTTLVNVETGQTEYTAENNGGIAKAGWSPDGAYFVFPGFGLDGPALHIWSVAASAVFQSISDAVAVSEWSPDQRFAYLRSDENDHIYWLGFASPRQTFAEIQFRQYETGLIDATWSSQWSPDARYLALRSYSFGHGLDLGGNLLLFGRDAEIVPMIQGIIGPRVEWPPDGQTFLYLQRRGMDIAVRDLMVYQIEGDTGVLKVLLRNVRSFSRGQTRLAAFQSVDNIMKEQIVLMDLDGAHQKLLDFDQRASTVWVGDTFVGALAQDDHTALVKWIDRQDKTGQMVIPFQNTGSSYLDVSPGPGGEVLVSMERPTILYLLDLEDATLTRLGSSWRSSVWSPDGSRVAFIDDGSVLVVDANDPRNGHRVSADMPVMNVVWIPCS